MITVSSYHPDNYLFVGNTVAQEDPKSSGEYLLPKYTTTNIAPVAPAGLVAVYLPAYNTWSVVPDKRGDYYDVNTQEHYVVKDYDATIPANWTSTPPPVGEPNWQYDGSAWVRTLYTAKIEKHAEIDQAYRSMQSSTITHASNTYLLDMQVLNFLVMQYTIAKAIGPAYNIPIVNSDGDVINITTVDLEMLIEAIGPPINAVYVNYIAKSAAIEAATTISAVDSITW